MIVLATTYPATYRPGMNRPLALSLVATAFVALVSTSAWSQEPKRHSLSLEVRPTGSGGATKSATSFDSANGTTTSGTAMRTETTGSTRTRKSSVELEITVRNLSSQADTTKVEWYFFAKPVGKSEEFLHDSGSRELQVKPAGEEKVAVESKETSMTVSRESKAKFGTASPGSTKESKSGTKASGWIVRLVSDNAVLAVRASTPALETMARNTPQIGGGKPK
jgi:hypothetical protein